MSLSEYYKNEPLLPIRRGNKDMFHEPFFKNVSSFINEKNKSFLSSGYLSEITANSDPVFSGNLESFSGKNTSDDLIYKRCNFSRAVFSSWSQASAGLVTTPRELETPLIQITVKNGKRSLKIICNNTRFKQTSLYPKLDELDLITRTIKGRNDFFRQRLKKSFLQEFHTHPERLRHIRGSLQNIDQQEYRLVENDYRGRYLPEKTTMFEAYQWVKYQPRSAMTHPSTVRQESVASVKTALPNISYKPEKFCKFCIKNGEPKVVYSGHVLKAIDGSVICPVLRRYVCEICGATGAKSHTRKYCPHNRELSQGNYMKHSSAIRRTSQ